MLTRSTAGRTEATARRHGRGRSDNLPEDLDANKEKGKGRASFLYALVATLSNGRVSLPNFQALILDGLAISMLQKRHMQLVVNVNQLIPGSHWAIDWVAIPECFQVPFAPCRPIASSK